jgi:hypothetical protein
VTRIAIDIDGTLGYRNRQQYIKTCNDVLKLAIPEERLQDISLNTFYQLPEVLAYKARVGEAYCTKAMGWIDYHPKVLRAMHLLPRAKDGVQMLATLGNVAYYTARYTPQSEERNKSMAQATFEWLAASAFLNPTDVLFCDGLLGKLQLLAQEITHNPEPVILVDDQYARLLAKMTDLHEETAQHLNRSLILVAYGARTVPKCTPVPVVAFPSWKEVSSIYDVLQKCASRIFAKHHKYYQCQETPETLP